RHHGALSPHGVAELYQLRDPQDLLAIVPRRGSRGRQGMGPHLAAAAARLRAARARVETLPDGRAVHRCRRLPVFGVRLGPARQFRHRPLAAAAAPARAGGGTAAQRRSAQIRRSAEVEEVMATKLNKQLKREIEVDGKPYMITLSPEGVKLTEKGKRLGREHS